MGVCRLRSRDDVNCGGYNVRHRPLEGADLVVQRRQEGWAHGMPRDAMTALLVAAVVAGSLIIVFYVTEEKCFNCWRIAYGRYACGRCTRVRDVKQRIAR